MDISKRRNCPICDDVTDGIAFPYHTYFNEVKFDYLRCRGCNTIYVDPIPDSQTFSIMYDKSNYHDKHYNNENREEYRSSVQLLEKYLVNNGTVLDYGCGIGLFLNELKNSKYKAHGVEFDKSAAAFASSRSECLVQTIEEFDETPKAPFYDCIHFGDVLEHLQNPSMTMQNALERLKFGGVLFAEGPLEINPSFVYYTALFFGSIKHAFNKDIIASHSPTHLFRTGAEQQLNFFHRHDYLELVYWEVYETGFPYSHGGFIKKLIANIAKFFGGKYFLNLVFGNRFRAVFIKKK